jgi:2-polyprenyl-6-methoxyphenol hydroxylase-like FAD-dependent oxidoreductase
MPDPVLIVGAGPTGMMAALELSRLGIPIRVIEKAPGSPQAGAPREKSRAIGVQARTLELLEMRGLSQELVHRGHPTPGGGIYAGNKRLFRLDFSRIDSRYPYSLLVSQTVTEQVLRDAVEAQGVVIERGVELVGFAQDALAPDPNPVKVVLRHVDGRLEQTQAPWLIDAEGAHSTVRTMLDLPFEGRTLEETYALADVLADGDLGDEDFYIFTTPRGPLGMYPLGRGRFRLVATVAPSKARTGPAPTVEELQAIYDARSPVPARLSDMSWGSWFRIHSRMVPHLRAGRVLLGGDAAHIHSPAGGLGMNTGIQDMINLGWKLALVMRGQAPEALLDSYEQERLPVIRRVVRMTESFSEVTRMRGSLARTLLRSLVLRLVGARPLRESLVLRMSQLAVGYRPSPLSEHHGRAGRLRAGDRVPDLRVRSRIAHGEGWQGRTVFELLDPLRFTLLVSRPQDSAGADWCSAVQPWEPLIGIAEIAPALDDADRARFRAVFGDSNGVFLVRPDGYVGFEGGKHASPKHLEAYCGRWLTARSTPSVVPSQSCDGQRFPVHGRGA